MLVGVFAESHSAICWHVLPVARRGAGRISGQTTTIASISNCAPFGSDATPTVERAG